MGTLRLFRSNFIEEKSGGLALGFFYKMGSIEESTMTVMRGDNVGAFLVIGLVFVRC